NAIRLFTMARTALVPGGMFITANINDNKEREFIGRVLGWNMIYRPVEELADLVKAAGFSESSMKIFYEPLRIHGLVVARA
ncbi:MAG: hypothetical protein KGJ35_03085, partial [Patescibacteria group bacterium]|nr:hypothetical protein [Patescibacteria group bacterium]